MKRSVEIPLGTEWELTQLFSFIQSDGVKFTDYLAHTFNQSLQRDLFYGSWADVYDDDGTLGVKITSPNQDVSGYERVVPAWLDAGRTALAVYSADSEALDAAGMRFLLPFGLSMASSRSVQLLHYPPTETFTYLDYLYSPTNRRWECLLANNGFDGARNTVLERIVDVVPIAADGGDSSGIEPYNQSFIPYALEMLEAVLTPVRPGLATQPVVAYGGPVRDWLEAAFPKLIEEELGVLSLLRLPLGSHGSHTPVLCANHPSRFLYFEDNSPETNLEIMQQDLVAASWQIQMAADWNADPEVALEKAQARWPAGSEQVARIARQQEVEFGWGP